MEGGDTQAGQTDRMHCVALTSQRLVMGGVGAGGGVGGDGRGKGDFLNVHSRF